MINRFLGRLKRTFAWGAFSLIVSSCDWVYDPTKFAHGELESEARIDIVLDTPYTLEQLLPRYIEIANSGGYPHSSKRYGSYTLEELYSESFGGGTAALCWYKEPKVSGMLESIMLMGNFTLEGEFDKQRYKREALAHKVILVFRSGSTESLTKEDWVTYFKFKDEILPRVFPDATISVTKRRHPAVFTDDDILRQIQRETDFDIPEKYLPRQRVLKY